MRISWSPLSSVARYLHIQNLSGLSAKLPRLLRTEPALDKSHAEEEERTQNCMRPSNVRRTVRPAVAYLTICDGAANNPAYVNIALDLLTVSTRKLTVPLAFFPDGNLRKSVLHARTPGVHVDLYVTLFQRPHKKPSFSDPASRMPLLKIRSPRWTPYFLAPPPTSPAPMSFGRPHHHPSLPAFVHKAPRSSTFVMVGSPNQQSIRSYFHGPALILSRTDRTPSDIPSN